MVTCIHQCEHAIYLGLIDKIKQSDLFVLMDNVQFEKNNFQNRNKIRTKNGSDWITVTVEQHNHKPLNEVKVEPGLKWRERYTNLLYENYNKSPYFDLYFKDIIKIICSNYPSLFDLNFDLLTFIMEKFQVKTPILKLSDLQKSYKVEGTKSQLLANICDRVGADSYLSGQGGKKYLFTGFFEELNIKVKYHEFDHPKYQQLNYIDFIPNLSSLDCLFNTKGNL